MATRTIPDLARAAARIRALEEGVKVILTREEPDIMEYLSPTRPGFGYIVTLRDPDTEGKGMVNPDTCDCPAGKAESACVHVEAAWLMSEARQELYELETAKCPSNRCTTKNCVIHPDPNAVCICCGDTLDTNGECACFCDPEYCKANGLAYCAGHHGCNFEAKLTAQTFPPLSPTLEAELAELVAERELEADPFHRG